MITTRNRQVSRTVGKVAKRRAAAGRLVTGNGYAGIVLPGVPESVATARAVTRRVLSTAGAQAQNAVTCVSELVTNAILHTRSGQAGGHLAVTLEIRADRSVVVSVLDEGARTGRAVARPGGEHGRGLSIVEILSDDWGVIPMHGSGRLTWCRLDAVSPSRRDATRDAQRDGGRDARRDGWSLFSGSRR
jgi:anti-sigma regulatory factor (Ser/Thr protein kinase)